MKDTDFYSLVPKAQFSIEATITFKYPTPSTFEREKYDWYITVALEKADQVKKDRHLLTRELLLSYRWAIREGYQHGLDTALQKEYDYPRNQNTIAGIEGYIKRIKDAAEFKD